MTVCDFTQSKCSWMSSGFSSFTSQMATESVANHT